MLSPGSMVLELGHDLDLENSFDFECALRDLKRPRSEAINFEGATRFLENDENAGIEPHMIETFVSKILNLSQTEDLRRREAES